MEALPDELHIISIWENLAFAIVVYLTSFWIFYYVNKRGKRPELSGDPLMIRLVRGGFLIFVIMLTFGTVLDTLGISQVQRGIIWDRRWPEDGNYTHYFF